MISLFDNNIVVVVVVVVVVDVVVISMHEGKQVHHDE
jgi:hypothetical protein